jgi:hypothetical protein
MKAIHTITHTLPIGDIVISIGHTGLEDQNNDTRMVVKTGLPQGEKGNLHPDLRNAYLAQGGILIRLTGYPGLEFTHNSSARDWPTGLTTAAAEAQSNIERLSGHYNARVAARNALP